MADEADPREALGDKDVTTRAAAVRAVARSGGVSDLPRLLELARTDKSPSVRLYAAAGAADVAMAHAEELGSNGGITADDLVREATGGDPGHNPSLLMVLAAVPTAAVLTRLGRILRDPRYDVRAGAATTLRRMAMSAGHLARMGRQGLQAVLEPAITGWLAEGRHPPDAVAEMVRITGEADLAYLEGAIQKAGARHAEGIDLALQRLRSRTDPSTWAGLWASWGGDVLEPATDDPTAWKVIASGEDALASEARMVWVARAGADEPVRAIQVGGLGYWEVSDEELVKTATDLLGPLEPDAAGCAYVAGRLEAIEGISARRLRARLLWRAGRAADAQPILQDLTSGKKPKGEDLWVLAHVASELGDAKAAKAAITGALAAAPRKAPWRDDAEALQRTLS